MPRGLFCFAALCATTAVLLCACTRSLSHLPTTQISPEQATQTAIAYRVDLAALAATAASRLNTGPTEASTATQLPSITEEPSASPPPAETPITSPAATPTTPPAVMPTAPAATSPPPPPPTSPGAITLAPPQAAQNAGCNRVKFVKDVATPDNTRVHRNQHFVKTWRLKNAGGCTWTPDYALVFVDGSQMQGQPIHLPGTVAPGESINLSVGLVAPGRPGTHRGYWMLQGPEGRFGMGDSASQPFWVQVIVTR